MTGLLTQDETTTGRTQGETTFGKQLAVTVGRKHEDPKPVGMQEEPQAGPILQLEVARQEVLEIQPPTEAQLEPADPHVQFFSQVLVSHALLAKPHPRSLLKVKVAK